MLIFGGGSFSMWFLCTPPLTLLCTDLNMHISGAETHSDTLSASTRILDGNNTRKPQRPPRYYSSCSRCDPQFQLALFGRLGRNQSGQSPPVHSRVTDLTFGTAASTAQSTSVGCVAMFSSRLALAPGCIPPAEVLYVPLKAMGRSRQFRGAAQRVSE